MGPPLERDFISSPSLKGQLWAEHQTGADRSGRAKWPVAKATTSILSFSQSECRKSEKINCMRMLIIIKHELFSSSDLHDVQTPTEMFFSSCQLWDSWSMCFNFIKMCYFFIEFIVFYCLQFRRLVFFSISVDSMDQSLD